jgi:hypothetical protein
LLGVRQGRILQFPEGMHAAFLFSLRPSQAVGLFARGNLAGDCQRFQIDDRDFVFFADGYKSA